MYYNCGIAIAEARQTSICWNLLSWLHGRSVHIEKQTDL